MQMAPQYNDEVVAQPVQLDGKGGVVMDLSEGGDDKFKDAVRVVVERRKASTSMLQTRLGIGYSEPLESSKRWRSEELSVRRMVQSRAKC